MSLPHTLALFDESAILSCRQVARVVKHALRVREWQLSILTERSVHAVKKDLDAAISISKYPKAAPIFSCRDVFERLARFSDCCRDLTVDNLVVYETSQTALNAYSAFLVGRKSPPRWTLYSVDGASVTIFASTAVHHVGHPSK